MKKKKILSSLLLATALISLAGCGDKEVNDSKNPSNVESSPTVEVTPTETPTPIETPTPTPTENYYTVEFETYGGTEISPINVKEGEMISNLVNPEKTGFEFKGWYIDDKFSELFDIATAINKEYKLYARFVEIFDINFDTDGGNEIEAISYTECDNISLPLAVKSGFVFSHWIDEAGNTYNVIPTGTTKDLNLKAVYNEAGEATVSYTSLANNIAAGSASNYQDSIFKLNCEVRGRIKTWTNPMDSSDTITWNQSYKLGSSSYNISFTAPGNGELSFYVQNGSSGAASQFVAIDCSDGMNSQYEFSGKTTAIGSYPAGSPVVKITVPVYEGLTYTIKRVSGTIDIFELNLSCQVLEQEVTNISINNTGKTEYVEGDEFDPSSLQISAIHGDNLYFSDVNMDNVVVDSSNVDMTTPGVYDVIVKYGQFELTYPITVYGVESIDLGFNATYNDRNSYNGIYVNGKVQTIYELGEELNPSYLTIIANTSLEDVNKEFIVKNNISYTGFDSSVSGTQTVTVKFDVNFKKYSANYDVYVVDTDTYKDAEGNYVVTVDKSYTGIIGAQNGENGNMFTTIAQALEYLETSKIENDSNKILNVSAGYYKEKLEINVANLTIIGAGSTKATYSDDTQYNAEEYAAATIIEWDSLYGIVDESGYSQITDSTATVAVRESAINCTFENITLSNYWNCEEVFQAEMKYLEQEGIAVNGKANDHRALALIVQADKFTMTNCSLLGYQDTVEFMTGRQYVSNTYISGNTDFIFGTNCTTYFYNCEIFVNYKIGGSGYITAVKGCNSGESDYVEYGFIFDNCNFTADSRVAANSFAIGRPWGAYSAVMVMNSNIGAHVGTTSSSRYVAMGGINTTDATVRYKEYNNTGDSAITESISGVTVVDDATAANYNNIAIIFGTTNGNMTYEEAWTPNLVNENE